MKIFNNIVYTLSGISLTFIMFAGIYYLVIYVINVFKGLDNQVLNTIFAALVIGLFIMILSSIISKRKQSHKKLNKLYIQKVKIYRRFIKEWSSNFRLNKKTDLRSDPVITDEMHNIEMELMLVASDEVIKTYIEFRDCENNTQTLMDLIGRFILEMRKDIGNSNIGVNRDDLSLMFLDMAKNTPDTKIHPADSAGQTGMI